MVRFLRLTVALLTSTVVAAVSGAEQQLEEDVRAATLQFLEPGAGFATTTFIDRNFDAPVEAEAAVTTTTTTTTTMLGHYGKPPGDCEADEKAFEISGVPGMVCAPTCDSSGGCPSDLPDGVTARPQCALENRATGEKYCVLICSSRDTSSTTLSLSESFFHLRGGEEQQQKKKTASDVKDGQCGDASCQMVQAGLGICTWSV